MGRGRSDSAIRDGWQTDALADAVAPVVDAMGLSVAGRIRAAVADDGSGETDER